MNTDCFLTAIYLSCKNHLMIREDGKKLTLFNKISDFFYRKHNHDHFLKACQNLCNIENLDKIKQLPPEKQIEIIARMRQIQKKISRQNLKDECHLHIETVEEHIFENQNQNANGYIEAVFNKIKESANRKYYKIEDHVRNLEEVIRLCSKNKDSFSLIVDQSIIFLKNLKNESNGQQKNKKNFYTLLNEKFVDALFLKSFEVSLSGVKVDPYAKVLSLKLENDFKNFNKPEISNTLSSLERVMNHNQSNEVFIESCLRNVDSFLGSLFHYEDRFSLPETNKTNLFMLKALFKIIDKHLPVLVNKKDDLVLDLQLKCANLPCPLERSSFSHLFLSEKAQLELLVEKLQKKEDKVTDKLCSFLKDKSPSLSNIHHLAKLITAKSTLSEENINAIIETLKGLLKNRDLINWRDYQIVKDLLKTVASTDSNSFSIIDDLRRISKSKAFFANQKNLDERDVVIPRWYHTTSRDRFKAILSSETIEVHHKQRFKGAWLSTKIEKFFGAYSFSFTNKLTHLDSTVSTANPCENQRWRGLQKAVPLKKDEHAPYLALVGVPLQSDKLAQTKDKIELTKLLKQHGFLKIKVMSFNQLDFIQKQVALILGAPNLPDQWWGPGRFYSEHQIELHSKIRSMSVESSLFEVREEDLPNQVAIAQILQSVALPLYKMPMPQLSSYRSEATGLSVKLRDKGQKEYRRQVDKIDKKLRPSRGIHGTMHCVRVALWTQVLSKVYENLGRKKIANPILLATAGAFHDVAREEEGKDYWDNESSEALKELFRHVKINEQNEEYIKAIKDKDPKKREFSSDIQRIVHDADCLEIMRVVGEHSFKKDQLCFYGFIQDKDKVFVDQLIQEVADFIKVTEQFEVRNHLEHQSEDFYGDLIRLMFQMNEKDSSRFPRITEILRHDMKKILSHKTAELLNV